MKGRVRIGLALVGLLGAVLAAGGLASAATVTVNLANGQFQPANPRIDPGDTVVFWNNDTQAHDVAFEAGFSTGGAGSMAPGQNWSHTFNETGTFRFRCQLHSPDFVYGMVGAVLVGNVTPPPPKSPGFEIVGALAAVGAAAVLAAAARRH